MGIVKENVIKNLLALLVILISYPIFKSLLKEVNESQVSNLLVIISIFFISIQFAGFSFSYADSKKDSVMKMLGHVLTFFAMSLTGILLETIVITVQMVYPSFFPVMTILSVLIYITVLLFDFWDALKLQKS
ncbi:hypothetical protein KJ918_04200 [Patescibacteria group bacterium]|nr:hypothetical protein [Patescibacteria group bacterium]